jgi:putative flippase GtrA
VTLPALIARYATFCVLATVANLAAQRLLLTAGDTGTHFLMAVAAGTIVGLIVKYALDKRWIFFDDEVGVKNNSKKFCLYVVMGLITTAIFWGTETAFWLIWPSDAMREFGAILGLSVGYVVKYNLDCRYVFTRNS